MAIRFTHDLETATRLAGPEPNQAVANWSVADHAPRSQVPPSDWGNKTVRTFSCVFQWCSLATLFDLFVFPVPIGFDPWNTPHWRHPDCLTPAVARPRALCSQQVDPSNGNRVEPWIWGKP
eukprot:s336_g22.t1